MLSASVMCRLLCGTIARLGPGIIGDEDPVPTVLHPGDGGFVGPLDPGAPDDTPILNGLKKTAQEAERDPNPAGTTKNNTPPPDNTAPTSTPSGGGAGDTSVDTEPATPVVRPVSVPDIPTTKAFPSTWSRPALLASPRAPLGATARIYPLPAEANGLFNLEDRLAQAENLMYKDALAAGRNTGKDRTWNAGVNTENGDIAVACSGLGTGFCAEPNVVAALGGDSSNVKFTIAIQRQRLFGDGSPWAWLPKPVCELCQAQYRPTQWGTIPPFVPGASWSVQ